jgi:hypothetical protein
VAARFTPTANASGPEIVIYRIDDHARAALGAQGALDPLWWTGAIPGDYRLRSARLLAGDTSASPAAVDTSTRGSNGEPSPWVFGLLSLYSGHVATFAGDMARSLSMVGRFEDAAPFAEANHMMMPRDVPSCLLASVAFAHMQRWPAARAAIERTLSSLPHEQSEPLLMLQYARVLTHTGETARAREVTRHLVASLAPGDPIAVAAKADLARLQ